jgi:tetratricopeptide (TPR) repeat protein
MLFKWLTGRGKAAEPTPSLLKKAQALRAQGEIEAARQACMELLAHASPDEANGMALMAALAADQRQFDSGMEWAARALAADRNCIPALFARGRLLEGAQRYPEAEEAYRKVTLLNSSHAQAHTNLGCMLHIQGRFEAAIGCYRRALQLEPGQPEALRNYALIAGGVAELREAAAGFEQLLAKNPRDASAQHQLAHLYLRLGRSEEALAGYERAIALEPEEAEFHFARAQVLLLLGRYAEGWREYERAAWATPCSSHATWRWPPRAAPGWWWSASRR